MRTIPVLLGMSVLTSAVVRCGGSSEELGSSGGAAGTMSTCSPQDRDLYLEWAGRISISGVASNAPVVAGTAIEIRGQGLGLIPPEAKLRWSVWGPAPGRPGVLERIFEDEAETRGTHDGDTRKIAIVPAHAPAGEAYLAFVVENECAVATAGTVVIRTNQLLLASYRGVTMGIPAPLPTVPPPQPTGLRAYPQGPEDAAFEWDETATAFGYRVFIRRGHTVPYTYVETLPRDRRRYTFHRLNPSTEYDVAVLAFNPAGEGQQASILYTTPRATNEGAYVQLTILDQSPTPVPFGRDGSGSASFAASSAIAYFDNEGDHIFAGQSSTPPNGPFPYFIDAVMPTSRWPHSWVILDGNRYDRDQNGHANIILYATVPPTANASSEQYFAAHLRYDNGKLTPLIATAGDLAAPFGTIMYSDRALVSATAELPGSADPRLEGSMEVELKFLEPYSTTEGIDFFDHTTLVRVDFSVSLIDD